MLVFCGKRKKGYVSPQASWKLMACLVPAIEFHLANRVEAFVQFYPTGMFKRLAWTTVSRKLTPARTISHNSGTTPNSRTGRNYHCLTAEFGTFNPIQVLGDLRAENRAHFYAEQGQGSYERAKRQVTEAFCPAASAWRERVIDKGLRIIDQAVRVCFEASVG